MVFPLRAHLYQYFGIFTSFPAAASSSTTMPLHGMRLSKGLLPLPLFTAGVGFGNSSAASVRLQAVEAVPSHSTPYTAVNFTCTLQVLSAGALWLASAATCTVTVAFPFFSPVTVTVFPLTCVLTTPLGSLLAVMAPVPARVTVMLLVGVPASTTRLSGCRDRLPAAFWMVQATVFASVPPPAHWVPTVSFRVNMAS